MSIVVLAELGAGGDYVCCSYKNNSSLDRTNSMSLFGKTGTEPLMDKSTLI